MHGSLGHIIWTVCYLSVLTGLSAYGIHRYFIIYLYLKNRKRPPVPSGHFEQLPRVTMQLPIFNEVYVAERLLRSVSEVDYPRELLQIQVLDDSTDETREITASCAEELRQRGFNVQLIHRVDRTGFKAGALSAGLDAAEGEFLCILDADFVPQKDLLKRTIHFFTDPKVGMIQTRWGHLNRGYSLLTRMQAIFLDGHLLLEQTARSRSGRFFNFNGTAGLWRRSCIQQSGGWQADTLYELSRAARGVEVCLSGRRCHPGRVAGGHERLQVAATSLDQGFGPNVQEIVTDNLAQPAPVSHQGRSYWPFDVELCLLAPCSSVRSFASIHRRASGWLAAHLPCGRSVFSCRVGPRGRVLYLRPTRAPSADMDEAASFSAMPARLGNWPFAEQRTSRPGSADQSQIRFHADAQVWH